MAELDVKSLPHKGNRPRSRRFSPLWTIVLSLAASAALVFGSAKLTWSWSTRMTDLRGAVVQTASGEQLEVALVPIAVLLVASIAAVIATHGWVRRALAVVPVAVGVLAVVLATRHLDGVFGAHPSGYPTVQVLFGHLLAVLGGLAAIVAGVLVFRHAGRLPRMGAAYQTPGAAKRTGDPDKRLWDALSDGDDPTQTADDPPQRS